MGVCWSCSAEIPDSQYHRLDRCDRCGRDTHACLNCVHHDRTYNNECRESSAERIVDKEKSNFCDFFKPGSKAGGIASSKESQRALAEALFRKK